MISYGPIQFLSKVPPKNEKGGELTAMVPMYANILLQYNT